MTNVLAVSISAALSFGVDPLPVQNFRHVLAVLVDVLRVLDEFVVELLLPIEVLVSGLPQAVNGVHYEMETAQIVRHRHVEGRRAPVSQQQVPYLYDVNGRFSSGLSYRSIWPTER